ncbi:TIGR03943 family putative permease subunit [Neobacillus kokaensis]|uniref:TIGR03943 family protein n=1 Tax=Neobacillus kokaensis TaxID=2759023 RepID=A0ABQ3N802_9BACI|nr:TIGR03943 family protein [Neobacillus kokaensis]GHI00833.1 TIGR03943 family protein [Neobacillus kokaensis]
MKFHVQHAVRAFILLAFSVMLFKLHFTDEITKFINPKYQGLSQSASVLFLILFFIQITRIWSAKRHTHHYHCHHEDHNHDCSHDHGDSPFNSKKFMAYAIIIFPLVTGFLLPAKVLDASIVDKKGGMAILSNQNKEKKEINSVQEDLTIEHNRITDPKIISEKEFEQFKRTLEQSSTIKMNDDVYSIFYGEISTDPEKFKGREIELKGFVYKEDEFNQDQLVISRFSITHCVADAGIIGFLSEFKEAASIEENTWIKAKGTLDISTFNGTELPIIKITKWKKIKQPKQPYLYPIDVKVY